VLFNIAKIVMASCSIDMEKYILKLNVVPFWGKHGSTKVVVYGYIFCKHVLGLLCCALCVVVVCYPSFVVGVRPYLDFLFES